MRSRGKLFIAGVTLRTAWSAIPVAAQSPRPDTTYLVTTQGADTVAIEWYARTGRTITGAWIQHQGG